MLPNKIQQAITLIESGDRSAARNLLITLLQTDPQNEAAWLWLAETLSSDAERIRALERSLSYLPNSQLIQRSLQRLRVAADPGGSLQANPVVSAAPLSRPPAVDRRQEIQAIVHKFSARIKDDYIFFFDQIPPKKLQNVLRSYARVQRDERPLVLVDNTTFGSARDGALLTDCRMYVHNMQEQPSICDLSAMRTLLFVEGLTSKLYVNDISFLEINFPSKQSMHLFTEMLKEIAALYGNLSGKGPAEALKELKRLLDAGIINEDEYRVKRQKYLEQL